MFSLYEKLDKARLYDDQLPKTFLVLFDSVQVYPLAQPTAQPSHVLGQALPRYRFTGTKFLLEALSRSNLTYIEHLVTVDNVNEYVCVTVKICTLFFTVDRKSVV